MGKSFPSALATGDGNETVGEVTAVKIRNGMSFDLFISK